MRVAIAAMLLAVLGLPLGSSAFAADDRGLAAPASTPASASDSAAPASTSSANAASAKTSSAKTSSANASTTIKVSPAKTFSATASAAPTANALVAATLPDASPMSASDVAPGPTEIPSASTGATELKPLDPALTGTLAPAANLSLAPASVDPALGNGFLGNNSLAPIHALLAPPAAFVKLKTPPRAHSFFDARNTLGFATLGASLTADALSTQKGLAYPGFVEMNPIARPFVQSRTGAAAYNAGSFGLMAGLMYWAHKTEHHKLERILPFALGGWEGLLSARNYRVIANRPR